MKGLIQIKNRKSFQDLWRVEPCGHIGPYFNKLQAGPQKSLRGFREVDVAHSFFVKRRLYTIM